jgi:hypothetical protein
MIPEKNKKYAIACLGPSDLFASGFDLGTLRQRINSSIAKAKFESLPKAEREKRANEAIKIINQLIK